MFEGNRYYAGKKEREQSVRKVATLNRKVIQCLIDKVTYQQRSEQNPTYSPLLYVVRLLPSLHPSRGLFPREDKTEAL